MEICCLTTTFAVNYGSHIRIMKSGGRVVNKDDDKGLWYFC